MTTIKGLITEMDAVENLQDLTVVYEEIAVTHITRTRSHVFETRAFLERLSHIFSDIQVSYKLELLANLGNKRDISPLVLAGSKKNGKEAHVLLSANDKLYGDIIHLVFENFYQKTQSLKTGDIIIIGNAGKSLYEGKAEKKPYTYFELSDTESTREQMQPIIEKLSQYEKVFMYYGKFQSILVQTPQVTDISGNQSLEQERPVGEKQERYLFEPSIKRIVDIFQSQIFYALFRQTISEIELARFASRVKAMEKTNENISLQMKKLVKQQQRLKAWQANRKQLSQLTRRLYVEKRRSMYATG